MFLFGYYLFLTNSNDNTCLGYKKPENTFLGATLGRFANRIAGGKFVLISKNNAVPIEYYLNKNDGDNTLHGGYYSFGKVSNFFLIFSFIILNKFIFFRKKKTRTMLSFDWFLLL